MADRPPPSFTGQMPSSFDQDENFYNERSLNKVVRKIKEEPLIPLGITLTVFAFVNSYRAIRRGDSKQANRMFRARIAAQGFTVLAMVAGSMYYSQDRERNKELRKLKEQHDAEEKRQKWIRELEVRDDEEKAMRARLVQIRKDAEAMRAEARGEPAPPDGTDGTAGIIGRMGLWSKAEDKKKAEENKADAWVDAEDLPEKKVRNPKSSLGTLGEIVSASGKKSKMDPQAKDDTEKKGPK